MGKSRKGAFTHFVKWDDGKKGGRWYECNIMSASAYADGRTPTCDVQCHDGDKGERPVSCVTPIDEDTVCNGDAVLAYYEGVFVSQAYAFLGEANGVRDNGDVFVQFADGDKDWIVAANVCKIKLGEGLDHLMR